jgi:hypothetical protein
MSADSAPIRILVVDDHPSLRASGLTALGSTRLFRTQAFTDAQ